MLFLRLLYDDLTYKSTKHLKITSVKLTNVSINLITPSSTRNEKSTRTANNSPIALVLDSFASRFKLRGHSRTNRLSLHRTDNETRSPLPHPSSNFTHRTLYPIRCQSVNSCEQSVYQSADYDPIN